MCIRDREDKNIGVVLAEDHLRNPVRRGLRVLDDAGLDPRCEHNGIASRLPVPPGLLPLAVQGLLMGGMLYGGDVVALLDQGADQSFDEIRLARVRIAVDSDDHSQPPGGSSTVSLRVICILQWNYRCIPQPQKISDTVMTSTAGWMITLAIALSSSPIVY